MMGGAGHMQDMINKIKQNQAQRASRKNTRKKLNSLNPKVSDEKLTFKEVSIEELERINLQNRLKAKKDNKSLMIKQFIVFISLFPIIIYLLIKILIKIRELKISIPN